MEDKVFTFLWELKNFSFYNKEMVPAIYSDTFITKNMDDMEWIVFLYPRDHDDPDFISLSLQRFDKILAPIGLSVSILLIAADGTPGIEITQKANISTFRAVTFQKFASRSEAERLYHHEDTLKIRCVLRKIDKYRTTKKLFAATTGYVRKICTEWALTNFSQVVQGTLLDDSLQEGGESLFHVRLSIEGRPGREVVIIQFTRRCGNSGKPLSLNTLITVLNAQGKESEIWKQDQHVFNMGITEVWQFPTFISMAALVSQKNKYLVKDVLTLKCEIAMSLGPVASDREYPFHYVELWGTHSFDNLREDMKYLYNSKRFADVKLRAFRETVPAHKIVLQSRSQKFAEILDNVERTDYDFLDLTDVNIITLKRMLKYMYTDETDDLEYDDVVVDYITAHKYRIESLKCKYSFVLQSHLKVSNVCSILMHADDCCDHDLMNCAVDFIKQYRDLVCLSKEWKSLSKERRMLVQQTKEQLFRT